MFFSKKKTKPRYIAYMTMVMKYRNIIGKIRQAKESNRIVVLYFFEKSRNEMAQLLRVIGIKHQEITSETLLSEGVNFLNVQSLGERGLPTADEIFCLEVHPLFSVNQIPLEKAMEAGLKEIVHYTAMDEIVMNAFNAKKIMDLMNKMGMDENEAIENTMVTSSINKGQEKIENKISNPKDIRTSPEAWAEENNLIELME